eukprot:60860-Pyramimonas_sp.AAC.3
MTCPIRDESFGCAESWFKRCREHLEPYDSPSFHVRQLKKHGTVLQSKQQLPVTSTTSWAKLLDRNWAPRLNAGRRKHLSEILATTGAQSELRGGQQGKEDSSDRRGGRGRGHGRYHNLSADEESHCTTGGPSSATGARGDDDRDIGPNSSGSGGRQQIVRGVRQGTKKNDPATNLVSPACQAIYAVLNVLGNW